MYWIRETCCISLFWARSRAPWLIVISCGITCTVNSSHSSLRDKAYVNQTARLCGLSVFLRVAVHTISMWCWAPRRPPPCPKNAVHAQKTSNGIFHLRVMNSTLHDWCRETEGELRPPSLRIPSVILTLIKSSLFVSAHIWDFAQSEKSVADLTVSTLIKVITVRHHV